MISRLNVASVRARLSFVFVLVLTALAFASSAQAADPDFTWSTSVSTTQAGGHPNLTFNYASSSTQSLTRLDVDLPQGLMHRNNLAGACSNALFIADNCPATATVGTVATQIVVARITLSVPGTIYQLSAPSPDSDATFGVVLRPPLSSLGLTSKIFIRNQLAFTDGGGLRSSLVGPLNSITVLGVSLPSRISQLKLSYNSQTPTGGIALISNPTSCKPQSFTAVGTYSSQSPRTRTSSFTTTGCAAVPFAPTADLQLEDNTAGARTRVSLLVGNPNSGSASSLHGGHLTSFWNDWEEVLVYDLDAIDAGQHCTDAQATSAIGCPDASAIGELSADIEGFGTVTGKTYVLEGPGRKAVSVLTLSNRIKVRFPTLVESNRITFSGLPQLPFTAIRFKSKVNAAWITNTCTIRTAHFVADSFSGGHVTRDIQVPKPTCPPPAAPQITAGPDRGITINTTHLEYRFISPESGVTFECKKDDGAFAVCRSPFIDDWQGETAHSFSVRAVRGRISGPTTTATFTIDTTPPTVSFVGDEYADLDRDGIADKPFRAEDFEFTFDATDAGSGLDFDKLDATFHSASEPDAPSTRSVKQPRPHVQGHIQVGGPAITAPGPGTATATAVDLAGNARTIAIGLIIDTAPPSIAIDEPGVQFTEAGSAEIAFTTIDDSLKYAQGDVTTECYRKGWDGTVKGGSKIIIDRDTGRAAGTCSFSDLPEGSYKVTVKGWDPVKKEAVAETDLVVDRKAPTVAFTGQEEADKDGDGVADAPFRNQDFSFEFAAEDATSGLDPDKLSCSLDSKDPNQPTQRGKVRPSYTSGRFNCEFFIVPGGAGVMTLTAVDLGGHVTVLKLGVIIDSSPPSIAIKEQGTRYTDASSIEIPVESTDDSLRYPQGEVTIECYRKGWDGTVKGNSKRVSNHETDKQADVCAFDNLPEGSFKVTVKGWDPVKKEAVAETDLVVDRSAPTITLTNPDDADGDNDGIADERWRGSSIDVAAEIEDLESGIDPKGTTCEARIKNKGVIKGNVTINSGNRVVCTVDGLPDDDVEVELKAHNYVGTVTIVKRGFSVDTAPPTLAFTDTGDLDSDGDGFSDRRLRAARLGYEIRVEDARGSGINPDSGDCTAKPRKGGMVKGNVSIVNGSLLRCAFDGLEPGDTDIEISVADHRGHVTVLKAAVTIEGSP